MMINYSSLGCGAEKLLGQSYTKNTDERQHVVNAPQVTN